LDINLDVTDMSEVFTCEPGRHHLGRMYFGALSKLKNQDAYSKIKQTLTNPKFKAGFFLWYWR
jgi:hypothetical protein